ncbi:hypothetical protein AWC27_26335 [Mycobacterium szulgai]|uniref:Serine protease n=1 Tax=Mycobacterium szulgai TaxID=1787 RepID=A0A1X2ENB5_MYCSZ|nr:hypothetical protein AWC27_26335 [Mycobacterium szulgai]
MFVSASAYRAAVDTGFGTNQLYSACRLTITHHFADHDLECEPFNGTGFLVQFPSGDNRFGVVTNRHLTDAASYNPVEYKGATPKSVKIELWQSKNFRIEFTIDDPKPLYHHDRTIDVAVIPFGPKVDHHTLGTPYDKLENLFPDPNIDTVIFNHGLSWEYLLECEELWPLLQPGEFVLFPGYPVWYDKSQVRPVFRSGMIASDPQTEYRRLEGDPTINDGNQQVLFDAFSTSGNSGSPVFVAQRGIPPLPIHMTSSQGRFSPDGPSARVEFTGYHRSFLIGINAGHINDLDKGRDNDHAGLSRMHKLSAILDILRANTSPSAGTPTGRILIPVDAVDAHGGIPERYFDQPSESMPVDTEANPTE